MAVFNVKGMISWFFLSKPLRPVPIRHVRNARSHQSFRYIVRLLGSTLDRTAIAVRIRLGANTIARGNRRTRRSKRGSNVEHDARPEAWSLRADLRYARRLHASRGEAL